jgi:hypothetical protein
MAISDRAGNLSEAIDLSNDPGNAGVFFCAERNTMPKKRNRRQPWMTQMPRPIKPGSLLHQLLEKVAQQIVKSLGNRPSESEGVLSGIPSKSRRVRAATTGTLQSSELNVGFGRRGINGRIQIKTVPPRAITPNSRKPAKEGLDKGCGE